MLGIWTDFLVYVGKPEFLSAKNLAFMGFAFAVAGLCIRWKLHGIQAYRMPQFVMCFIAGFGMPYGVQMSLYPWLPTPPSIDQLIAYLPLAGALSIWVAAIAVKSAVVDSPSRRSRAADIAKGQQAA